MMSEGIESPRNTLVSETWRQAREGNWDEVADIWRHEGLKRGVERGLYVAGQSETGRALLERAAGGEILDTRLATTLGGLSLDGPIGVGAGWDKTGRSLLAWQAMGARHYTPGGVPFYSQVGNRMARLRTFDEQLGDHGHSRSLNAFGFYSPGSKKVLDNLTRQREMGDIHIPIIVQVTLNKEFYEAENRSMIPGMIASTIRKLAPVADGFSLGLSSPNTFGMRDAQDQREFMYGVVSAAREASVTSTSYLPVFLKTDGDGGEERIDNACEQVLRGGLNGLELINTTALLPIKAKYGATNLPGGLAGADPEYQAMAIKYVRQAYEAIGDVADIHGMGGVNSAEQAWQLILNGASAVSMNTGIRSLGRFSMTGIERGILDKLNAMPHITKLDQVIGSVTHAGPKAAQY